MAKGYKETVSIAVDGILEISEDGVISVEIEDIGTKSLAEIFKKLDGEPVKIAVKLVNELE